MLLDVPVSKERHRAIDEIQVEVQAEIDRKKFLNSVSVFAFKIVFLDSVRFKNLLFKLNEVVRFFGVNQSIKIIFIFNI